MKEVMGPGYGFWKNGEERMDLKDISKEKKIVRNQYLMGYRV